jgi:hypothetical protein
MGAGAAVAIEIAFSLLDRAMAYVALINKARAENRDISDAELDVLAANDNAARDKLVASIAKAKAEGL